MRSSMRLLSSILVCVSILASSQSHAQRIVSIGGTVTEIVYLLGEENKLVASDTSSIYPDAANRLPKVGYQRTLSVEGVLSMHPDLMLITPAAGPAKVIRQLKETNIKLVTINAPDTEEGIEEKVRQVAKALHEMEKGELAVTSIKQAFRDIPLPEWPRKPRLLFILQMGGSPMIAGNHTAPDALFKIAGTLNAANEVDGYKALTPEALLSAKPDAIVVTTQGLNHAGKEAIWSLPGLSSTPAGKAKRLIDLDALLALGMGPRTPNAITQLHQALSNWTP